MKWSGKAQSKKTTSPFAGAKFDRPSFDISGIVNENIARSMPVPKTPGIPTQLWSAIEKGGLGNFVRGNIAATGAYSRNQAALNRESEQQTALLASLHKQMKEGKISKEAYAKIAQGLAVNLNEISAQSTAENELIQGVTNKRKYIAGAVETAATPFMFSPTGLAGTSKLGLKIAEQSTIGAIGGASAVATGDDVSARDVAKGAFIGGTIGGGLVGGGKLLDKGLKATGSAVANTAVGKTARKYVAKASQKLGNDLRIIQDSLHNKEDADFVTELVNKARRSDSASDAARKKNPGVIKVQQVLKGMSKKDSDKILKEVTDHQIAVNNAKVNKLAIPKFSGSAEARQIYEGLNEATKPIIDMYHKAGLIDDATYKRFMADKDYIRIQRELDDVLERNGLSSSELSLKRSQTGQKLKGGNKEAVSPLASFNDWHNRAYKEVAVNDAVTAYTEALMKQGDAQLLRSADKVAVRKEMFKLLGDSRPQKNFLNKMTKHYRREVSRLEVEMNRLNKAGLQTYLKRGAAAEPDEAFRYGTKDVITNAKRTSVPKNIESSVGTPNPITGTLKTVQTIDGGVDPKKAIQSLIAEDPAKLAAIKRKMATREPKLAAAIDELTKYHQDLEGMNELRRAAYMKILNNADQARLGRATLGRIRNGINEIVAVDPEVAGVISSMEPIQLGAVGRILAIPARVLHAGATGLQFAFVLPNYLADQAGSAIISKQTASTHNAYAILFGIKNAIRGTAGDVVNKNFVKDELAQEYFRLNKYVTSPNLYRDLQKATIEAGVEYGIKPSTWTRAKLAVRKMEDIIGTTEHATRLQNFKGTYDNLVGSVGHEQAIREAHKAAWGNSVNFLERGEWAQAMKWANPYLNASIQGVRTTARAFQQKPTATTLKIGMVVGMPVVASTYWNLSDPERAITYANVNESTKRNNLVFVLGPNNVVTLKLPPGFKSFGQPLRNLVEAKYLDNRQSFLADAKDFFIEPFSPVGTGANEIASNVMPQLAKPTFEVLSNHSLFTGDNIVRGTMADRLPADQVYSNTSQLYRDVGKALNVSPLLVNHFVRSTGSGGAESLVNALDSARKYTVQPDAVTDNRGLLPQVAGRFRKGNQSNVQVQMYQNYEAAKKIKNSGSDAVTQAIKAGDYDRAMRIANDTNKLVDAQLTSFNSGYGKYMTSEERDTFDKLRKGLVISTKQKDLRKRAKS